MTTEGYNPKISLGGAEIYWNDSSTIGLLTTGIVGGPQLIKAISILYNYSPNVVSALEISDYLKTGEVIVPTVVSRLRDEIEKEGYILAGKVEIQTLHGRGYRLVAKE